MSSSKTFIATKEQHSASNPSQSVWVSANAGSGKTHVLVERVIRLLLEGAEPSAILCITYTKAAASEMSARLYARMSQWAIIDNKFLEEELRDLGIHAPDAEFLIRARRLFARALETPGGLKIQTIHAFCEKLLQQFPVEAGMSPGFRVLDERQAKSLLETAIADVLQEAEAGADRTLSDAFANIVDHVSGDGFEYLMRHFLNSVKGLKTVLGSELSGVGYEGILKQSLGLNPGESIASLTNDLISLDREGYTQHGEIIAGYKKHGSFDTAAHVKAVAHSNSGVKELRKLYFKDDNGLRVNLIAKATGEENPETKQFLDRQKNWVSIFVSKHDLLQRIEATASAFVLAKAIHHRIEGQKKSSAYYDFNDLIDRTAHLLNSRRATQWVLYKLDAGLKHILIDEAQDTSPAQWNIISALCTEFFSGHGTSAHDNRTVFVVGDRKQSIYSFQGADVAALGLAKSFLNDRVLGTGKPLSHVELSVSYRSTQKILDVVDLVFPANSPTQLGFDPGDVSENPHQSHRLGIEGVFELWPLVEEDEKSDIQKPWLAPVDREPSQSARRRLAALIAEKIKSWIGRRKIVARDAFVKPSDILILLQSRGPLFSMLIAELRKRGVPVAGADRLELLKSLAIQDLLVLLQWLTLPDDDYALACVLKSPLVPEPFSEEDLFELATSRATSPLWSQLQTINSENTKWLKELQNVAERAGPYVFYSHILTTFRKAMQARLGSEAVDASDAFLDQAMLFEMEQGQSLAGFLHWFHASETSIKREMEKASGDVRLMTIHGAKGLEANIVFLADAASVPKGPQSMPVLLDVPVTAEGMTLPIWALPHQTEAAELSPLKDNRKSKVRAEHNRLLYVAMTRACDELYVCGIKTKQELPEDSWYGLIEKAIGEPEAKMNAVMGIESLVTTPESISLPGWTLKPALPEPIKSIFGLTRFIKRNRETVAPGAAKAMHRGTLLHSLLQALPDIDEHKREAYARARARRADLEEGEVLSLLHIIESEELAHVFGPNSQAEVELRGVLADGREVAGRVDRLSVEDNEITLFDFKTERSVPEAVTMAHPYVRQMALYAKLLQQAYPSRQVKACLLWTQNAQLMWIAQELLTESYQLAISELKLEAP